jgi:hypothetical protein
MNRSLPRLIIILSIFGCLAASDTIEARSLSEIIKAWGDSIAHPQKRPRPRTTSHKDEAKSSPGKNASPTASPASVSASPSEPTIRVASAVPAGKETKRDLPYGIPVPGKQGLVTSPFAPDAGLVDVRSFSPGTEVKDPYTGKSFLTP